MIRVFVVDDHVLVREGLKAILATQSDIEVVGKSGSAETPTDLVEATQPDVIVLDALLPGVSGPEACRLPQRLQRDDTPPPQARPALNDNQAQILRLVGEGYTNREIAKRVHLSELTVKSYLQDIYQKLGVRNRVEAALLATREGWI